MNRLVYEMSENSEGQNYEQTKTQRCLIFQFKSSSSLHIVPFELSHYFRVALTLY